MPQLVATLCTFLVLSPLALMPGMGRFLFLPMTLAVMFAMASVYVLSLTLVPCASAFLLTHHDQGRPSHPSSHTPRPSLFAWVLKTDRSRH
jgi:multidrug efflux pump subunit AcrB